MTRKPIRHLDEQFHEWFRQYGSHVILHRAVPHLEDGLKPSQRRVLHSLQELEDGRYNKVANVVGNTLKYHPHGETSVVDTLVGMGQKGYLIDTGGNWGDVLTGDRPAAMRYIEARLTPLAKEILFNEKTTEWVPNYDGRSQEPRTLPVKFPLLLIQGTEGIAVSLACRILPHNFTEVAQAAIAYLKEEDFNLLPDFPQGGILDASQYQNGVCGGKVKVRAVIVPHGKHSLEITEIPFGTTTTSLKESLIEAEEKGRVRIREIEDLTTDKASIILHLAPGTDREKTMAALYAFTDCEVAINPMGVVIQNDRPEFVSVTEILVESVERTRALIKKELELRLEELDRLWGKVALERIFIETRAYQKAENAGTQGEAVARIQEQMAPRLAELRRPPAPEAFPALLEIRFRRITKYDAEEAARTLEKIEKEEREKKRSLRNLTETTIRHYERLLEAYGGKWPRKTKVSAEPFQRTGVEYTETKTQKIYWNRKEGFLGTGLKKEEPLPFEVHAKTDIATIRQDGNLRILRPEEKAFCGENLLMAEPLDKTATYRMVYVDKTEGKTYAKRFQLTEGFIMKKDYGLAGANGVVVSLEKEDGESRGETTLPLDPATRGRSKKLTVIWKEVSVKGRGAKGIRVSRYAAAT